MTTQTQNHIFVLMGVSGSGKSVVATAPCPVSCPRRFLTAIFFIRAPTSIKCPPGMRSTTMTEPRG